MAVEKGGRLGRELEKREAKIVTQDTALKDAAKEKARSHRQCPLDEVYGELAAADAAYQGKSTSIALERLAECPEEHRAWEWYYLKSLCNGMRPTENAGTLPSPSHSTRSTTASQTGLTWSATPRSGCSPRGGHQRSPIPYCCQSFN